MALMCTNTRIINRVQALLIGIPNVRPRATEKQAINEALTMWAEAREQLTARGSHDSTS